MLLVVIRYTMGQYSYSTRSPSQHRMEMDESTLPNGHRMGVRVRIDNLDPNPTRKTYQSYCTCGWRQGKGGLTGPTWVRPKANARKYWDLHINKVRKQGILL